MKPKLILCLVLVLGCALTTFSTRAADSVQGQVVDETGKPLAGVARKISGTETLNEDKWTRVINLGWSADSFADAEGRFNISIPSAMRYDLQFHLHGFAPAFVYEVAEDSPALKVTLKRGERIHGMVTHFVDGKPQPLQGETVELDLPASDLWYQEKAITGTDGTFEFRACAPHDEPPTPSGNFINSTTNRDAQLKRKWSLVCAGKTVQIDVKEGKAVQPVNFEIEPAIKSESVVAIDVESRVAFDSFGLREFPPFNTNSISANAVKLLGTLKAGMTRAQLEKHFKQDGGLASPYVQRYYLDDKIADGKVIILEVAFSLAKMDDATNADRNKGAGWLQAHHRWWSPDDVVLAIGTPYLSLMDGD